MTKKTPLFDEHIKRNARMVDFSSWQMPVQYSGLSDEHNTCRTKVGLFDVSHMGEVLVQGTGALEFLNSVVTNDVSKIQDNQAQYTVMCNERGGCVDDLIIHRVSSDEFFICVNASNAEKDFLWLKEHAPSHVSVSNVSADYAQIAIQGRLSQELLQGFFEISLQDIKYYWFKKTKLFSENVILARTGYTGEDGFELYLSPRLAPKVWSALLDAGQPYGIKPCGLGARDTLRTEMKFALYGHEIDENLNPLEAGLGWVVKFNKCDFIGRQSLLQLKEAGLKRSLVGLRSLTNAIPRQGYTMQSNHNLVGVVTSGTFSPSLKVGIAIAYVEQQYAQIGTKLDVLIRDRLAPHEVVSTPFYKRPY